MGLGTQELKDILNKHRQWLRGEVGGLRANLQRANLQRADLQGADLQGANLQGANLRDANLQCANLQCADLRDANLQCANLVDANLQRANLQGADLQCANLRDANLQCANLQCADLQSIKDDFFARLLIAKNEVLGLYDALMRGRIDGSCYEGECVCFCGTIANLRKENYNNLTIELKPDTSSLTERWFLAIHKGSTPQSNPVSDITREWLEEFANANSIELPKYKLVSSIEVPEVFK